MRDHFTATADTLDHITALVCQVRPDWDRAVTLSILRSHAHQVDGGDLAVAAIRAAQVSDFRTPKAIGWRGPHWSGLETEPPEHTESRTRCRICGKTEPRCYSERPGPGDDHTFEPNR